MLTDLMRRAFLEAFSHNTGSEDLKAYMDSHFSVKRQRSELRDPKAIWLLAMVNDQPAAYAHMAESPAPACVRADHPVQLQRFYLLRRYWGSSIADGLMQVCLERLIGLGYS